MIRTKTLACTLVILLIFAAAGAALAQDEDTGSISGVVLRDVNANGICVDEDEPGVTGIPVQLVNRDDNAIVNLTSGQEGYYELVSATTGTWQATVNPGSGWRVTSQQTLQVLVSEDELDVEEVDFCIVQVTATGGTASPTPTSASSTAATVTPAPSTPATPTPAPPVLPQSGAPVSPALLLAAGVGLLFLVSGAGLFVRGRRDEDKS